MSELLQSGQSSSSLTGIILAAGLSRRAAPKNKLLLPGHNGASVIHGVAAAFCAAGLAEVIVVTGHQHEAVEQAVSGLSLRPIFAPDFASGMGYSIAAGVRAATQDCRGFLICPGDLPDMNAALVLQIAQAFDAHRSTKNIVPVHNGVRGHPVALVSALRFRLEALSGDRGAKVLLSTPEEIERTLFLSVESAAIHADNDLG